MRPGLQKNKEVLKQRDANRMSSSQELLNKARGWQGPAVYQQQSSKQPPMKNFNSRSTLLIPNIKKVF
jgi:hypothetical protein